MFNKYMKSRIEGPPSSLTSSSQNQVLLLRLNYTAKPLTGVTNKVLLIKPLTISIGPLLRPYILFISL